MDMVIDLFLHLYCCSNGEILPHLIGVGDPLKEQLVLDLLLGMNQGWQSAVHVVCFMNLDRRISTKQFMTLHWHTCLQVYVTTNVQL